MDLDRFRWILGFLPHFLGSAHCSFKIARPDSVFAQRPLAETNEVKHHVFGISYHVFYIHNNF